MTDPIATGTDILLYGHAWTVGALMLTGGERYYALTDSRGMVALMPADVVEVGQQAAPRQAPTPPQMPRKGKTTRKTERRP
jgi:hypothetical protein